MKKIFFIALVFIMVSAKSQNPEIDSLRKIISLEQVDTQKVNELTDLTMKLLRYNISNAFDTVNLAIEIAENSDFQKGLAYAYKLKGIIFYYKGNIDSSMAYFNKSLQIYSNLQDYLNEAKVYNNIGIIQKAQGNINEAIISYEKAIALFEKSDDKQSLIAAYINAANVYRNIGNFERSLDLGLKALEVFDKIPDKTPQDSLKMAHVYKTIANIYTIQKNFDDAEKNYSKALDIYKKLDSQTDIGDIYLNFGYLYAQKEDYQNELKFFKKALDLYKTNDKIALAKTNLSDVYLKLGYTDSAKIFLDDALEIYKQLGDNKGVTQVYTLYGNYYKIKGDIAKSEHYTAIALDTALKIGDIDLIKSVSETLYGIYKETGNYKKALEMFELYSEMKDSIFNKDNERKLTQMSLTYQFEKEKEKTELKYKEELKRQKLVRDFSLLASLLALIALLAVYSALRTKKRKNEELQQKNAEIMQQKEEIEAQRDEIERQAKEIEIQRDLAIKRGNELEEKNRDIEASIHYALRIQQAILPDLKPLSEFFADYFIFYKPRDIVSGDFYWLYKSGQKIIIVAADCTGHGVPGAFMSMLGISFLNQIARENQNLTSDKILELLRQMIIYSLKQDINNFDSSKDGMDMSVVIFDKKTLNLEYSGAYNSIYVISEKTPGNYEKLKKQRIFELDGNDKKLYELFADRMPVGAYMGLDKKFQRQQIVLSESDRFYMFSDGYPDLFDRTQNQKFTTKRFKRLLLETSTESMSYQKVALEKTFVQWTGESKQIDDILVIGIEI